MDIDTPTEDVEQQASEEHAASEVDERAVEADEADEEIYDVYEDEEGNEFVLIDGQRVYLDSEEFDIVEVEAPVHDDAYFESDDFNPLAYESVQAATDVANDLARAGGSIAREGAALAEDAAAVASELKGAMDDINNLLNPKNWLK